MRTTLLFLPLIYVAACGPVNVPTSATSNALTPLPGITPTGTTLPTALLRPTVAGSPRSRPTPTLTRRPTLVVTVISQPIPRIDVAGVPERVKVGDTFSVTGTLIDIGLPQYSLYIDEQLIKVATGSQVSFETPALGNMQVISTTVDNWRVEFVLKAVHTGQSTLRIDVTGEVPTGDGAWTWGSAGSGAITIEIVD